MLTFRRTKPTVSLRKTDFIQDEKPGDFNGQGIDHFGGGWWVVSAAGEKITTKP